MKYTNQLPPIWTIGNMESKQEYPIISKFQKAFLNNGLIQEDLKEELCVSIVERKTMLLASAQKYK